MTTIHRVRPPLRRLHPRSRGDRPVRQIPPGRLDRPDRAVHLQTSSASGLRPLWQEALILVSLLVVYRVGRLFGDMDAARGIRAGYRLLDIEHALRLPREQSLQSLVLNVPDLVRAANLYYAVMHFTVITLVLVWLHRRRPAGYLLLRRTIVGATATGLIVQLIWPVAPPRMLSGFVDTGQLLGPAVYGAPDTDHLSNQFAAMPSLHVGWALAVALVLIVSGTTRWRWLWVLHPLITLFVVVVTGNHYWLDGAVGSALVLVGFTGARLRASREAQRSATPSGARVRPAAAT